MGHSSFPLPERIKWLGVSSGIDDPSKIHIDVITKTIILRSGVLER